MSWPLASDFCKMVQHPQLAFRDPLLQACRIERTAHNQPRVWSGQFAMVLKGTDAQGKNWAIRAFTSAADHRREHYAQISRHLQARSLRSLVDFEYRESAIRSASDGKWYPLVVMDWVEGLTLTDWVQSKCRKGKGASIAKAVRQWEKLVEELRQNGIAHGDLQHGNVLITPQGRLKLVDYDGMCVPSLAGRPNVEVGLRPYQHPQRNEATLLSASLDHFSALVIYVALRALAADPTLWAKHVAQTGYDRLLFRSEDFLDRDRSPLYRDLMASPDVGLRELTAKLFAFAFGPIDQVPALRELVAAEPHAAAVKRERTRQQGEQPRPPRADSSTPRVVLEVVEGPIRGTEFIIDGHDTRVLGRGADCHLRILDDSRVSRHHFLLEAVPPLARLRDLGSRNGTWVNGVRHGGRTTLEPRLMDAIQPGAEVDLRHGDQIRVGRTVIRFVVEGPAAAGETGQQGATPPAEPERPSDRPDRIVDRFELGPEIGKGTSWVVYRAAHRGQPEAVAVKVPQPYVEFSATDQRRVLAAMAEFERLRHPHVAGILEAGTLEDSLYFVMEYCDSGNLEQHVQRQGGKLILGQARPLMLQCLDALEYAHQQKLVHGDLKPQNVLLHRGSGKLAARIADFGLARVLEKIGCTGLTATNQAALNYQLMPRERLLGFQERRPETDLWGLAATFYYMLSGQFPHDFSGRDPMAVILQAETVPLRDRERTVPAPVAKVVDRALAGDLTKRFGSAQEMKAHLVRAFGQVRGDGS
jgi:eukaryotic-like serine/threonine-protein kinase